MYPVQFQIDALDAGAQVIVDVVYGSRGSV